MVHTFLNNVVFFVFFNVRFMLLLGVGPSVQLHRCASCLQTLKVHCEPGGESMENSRLVHTKVKLALHFLRKETIQYR